MFLKNYLFKLLSRYSGWLSVLLLCISLPNNFLHVGVMAWISLIPLIIHLSKQDLFLKKTLTAWPYFQCFFLLFFHLNPFENSERYNQISIVLILLVFYFVFPILYAVLLGGLSHLLTKKPSVWTVISCSAGWALFEYVLTKISGLFPLTLAISQYKFPVILQLASIFGFMGISFFIIFSNFLIAFILQNKQHHKIWHYIFVSSCVLLFGFVRLYNSEYGVAHIKLALIQPNISWKDAYYSFENNYFYNKTLKQLNRLTANAIKHQLPITIIWPELAITDFDIKSVPLNKDLIQLLNRPHIDMLLGARVNDKNEIIGMDSAGIMGRYDKSYFVPFFEENEKKDASHNAPISIQNNKSKAGVFLCYELLFPDVSQNLVKKGANIIGCLAFNTWLGNTNWPLLHMAYLPLRTVESGRSGFFLNNNGPILISDAFGRTRQYLDIGVSGYAIVALNLTQPSTFFSKYQRILPLFFLILFVVPLATQRRRGNKEIF